MLITRKQKGFAYLACLHRILQPNRPTTHHRSELINLIGCHKPQIRLGLAWPGKLSFGLSDVEKFLVRRVITAKDNPILPARKVTDHFQEVASWQNARAAGRRETLGKTPERPMHRQQ